MKTYRVLVLRTALLAMLGANCYGHHIFLEGGTLAGQSLSGSEWSINVLPEQAIAGNVTCRYYGSRSIPSVIVPFGYTWTWGNRSSSMVTLSSNIPQTESTSTYSLNLQAPLDEGTYYILFGLRGEYNMSQIFSCTNWTAGSPVWNDGNDYFDMDDNTLFFAHENGYVSWDILMPGGYQETTYGVMPIRVNVVPEPATLALMALAGLLVLKRRK